MKIPGRILIIVTVAVVIAAGLYALVNASGSGATPGRFQGEGQFQPGGQLPAFDGARPSFPEGRRSEGFERGWIFGVIKNVGVIAIIVAIIVLPKSLQKKNRLAASKSNSEGTG